MNHDKTPLGIYSYMDWDFATFGDIETDKHGEPKLISMSATCRGEHGMLVASGVPNDIIYTVMPETSPITQLQLTIDLMESTKRGLASEFRKIKQEQSS
jgi:hypothetical protein